MLFVMSFASVSSKQSLPTHNFGSERLFCYATDTTVVIYQEGKTEPLILYIPVPLEYFTDKDGKEGSFPIKMYQEIIQNKGMHEYQGGDRNHLPGQIIIVIFYCLMIFSIGTSVGSYSSKKT